jgi:hypothetical protein
MADWETISSLATGAGTLVLAVATFAAVRSSNRSARVAELALQEQRRPLLAGSRIKVDPEQKIMFADEHWVRVAGGFAVAENMEGVIYLVASVRNFGSGIGVCQAWGVRPGLQRRAVEHIPEDHLTAQTRDLYVAPGDVGVWQGAIRDRSDPGYDEIGRAISQHDPITLELLYSDQVGAQPTITRFTLVPIRRDDADETSG